MQIVNLPRMPFVSNSHARDTAASGSRRLLVEIGDSNDAGDNDVGISNDSITFERCNQEYKVNGFGNTVTMNACNSTLLVQGGDTDVNVYGANNRISLKGVDLDVFLFGKNNSVVQNDGLSNNVEDRTDQVPPAPTPVPLAPGPAPVPGPALALNASSAGRRLLADGSGSGCPCLDPAAALAFSGFLMGVVAVLYGAGRLARHRTDKIHNTR